MKLELEGEVDSCDGITVRFGYDWPSLGLRIFEKDKPRQRWPLAAVEVREDLAKSLPELRPGDRVRITVERCHRGYCGKVGHAEALNASRPLCDIAQGSAAKERERKSQTERRGG